MTSELRRSFKQKAKAAFALPFRLRRGLDPLTGEDTAGGGAGGPDEGNDEMMQAAALRSNSFDVAPTGYIAPTVAWFTGLLRQDLDDQQQLQQQQQPPQGLSATTGNRNSVEDSTTQCDNDPETASTPGGGKPTARRTTSIGQQPKGTIPYVVTCSDTLASIAAQFDTTTSELRKFNRLMSDVVFPGKTIYVPDKDYVWTEPSSDSEPSRPSSPTAAAAAVADDGNGNCDDKQDASLSMLKLAGYPDMLLTSMRPISGLFSGHADDQSQTKKIDEDDWHEQFFKLNVKHIINPQGTDIVSGVLMVTPQAIMFEPTTTASTEAIIVSPAPTTTSVCNSIPLPDVLASSEQRDVVTGSAAASPVDGVENKDVPASSTMTAAVIDEAELQKYRMIVPLDIVTSIMISHQPLKIASGEDTGRSKSEHQFDDMSCAQPKDDIATTLTYHQHGDITTAGIATTPHRDSCQNEAGYPTTTGVVGVEISPINVADFDVGTAATDADDEREDDDDDVVELEPIFPLGGNLGSPKLPGGGSSPKSPRAGGTNAGGGRVGGPRALLARRIPKAAVSLLRFPYDSIRRELDSTCSSPGAAGTGSADEAISLSAAETPPPSSAGLSRVDLPPEASTPPSSGGQGLMSRTLGSISSLPSSLVDLSSSFFVRGGSSDGGCGPSPPKSALERTSGSACGGERSPSSVQTHSTSPMTFLFQPLERLVWGQKSPSGEAEAAEPEIATDTKIDEDAPLYMCIKVGKMFSLVPGPSAETFVRVRLKPEYWFTIPPDRIDEMYGFFMRWSPECPGADGEVGLSDRGFIAMEATMVGGGSSEYGAAGSCRNVQGHGGKHWEFVNVKEVRRLLAMAEVKNLPLPELSEASKILQPAHIQQLCYNLPARAEGCPWHLIYSSEKHGFSLQTMYRSMLRLDAPCLLIVHDDSDQIFGAMLPCALKASDSFYGTGESYLFTFYQGFKKYTWTGHNTFFIKGNADSLSFGAGEGMYGLWLDGDLYHGRTQCCLTYDNDLLTTSEDFVVRCLEIWGFS